MEILQGPGARMPWQLFPRMKGEDAMATMPRGKDATHHAIDGLRVFFSSFRVTQVNDNNITYHALHY